MYELFIHKYFIVSSPKGLFRNSHYLQTSSHVFKHLQSSESCRISCSADCFTVLDSATTKFQVKLKESMYIKWEKPDLNQQVKHINLTLPL